MFYFFKSILTHIVGACDIILMSISVAILIYHVVIAIYKHSRNEDSLKHILCKGITIALNFNLVAETLKLVIGPNAETLLISGSIIAIKILITFLFILEIKQDEMNEKVGGKKKMASDEIKNNSHNYVDLKYNYDDSESSS